MLMLRHIETIVSCSMVAHDNVSRIHVHSSLMLSTGLQALRLLHIQVMNERAIHLNQTLSLQDEFADLPENVTDPFGEM